MADSLTAYASMADKISTELRLLADEHPCSSHPLFSYLRKVNSKKKQLAGLLRNYDAHATVLRRFLLRAASVMPEEAVPLILENVRNEYGNGVYARNHQDQLRDLAWKSGITQDEYFDISIQPGVKTFIKMATNYYCPRRGNYPRHMKAAAIISGAITATELLAIKEFCTMQEAFAKHSLQNHHWFHHVSIELEHSDESLELALYFNRLGAAESVEYGMKGILDANIHLYDGLLAAMQD